MVNPVQPLQFGDTIKEGDPLVCIESKEAEPWLTEGTTYHFLRWSNGSAPLLQVAEHIGVNLLSERFVRTQT
jgi:hypothetical protein